MPMTAKASHNKTSNLFNNLKEMARMTGKLRDRNQLHMFTETKKGRYATQEEGTKAPTNSSPVELTQRYSP
jgi:hypothetical protein